jgi:formylglycine-generating enzyme required for sulfatase activity
MKMNWQPSLFLAAALFALPAFAQVGLGPANGISSNPTNDAPTLKDLMSTNSVVTNSVGMVLVKISNGLWAGKFDTAQDAYQQVMNNNPSAFNNPQRPVDSVSWNDAIGFCTKLTAKEKTQLPDGYSYNLPTQSQWETLVANATLTDAVMKLNNGNISSTAPVGSLGPNSFGLYDMRGNVWAWCLDAVDPATHVLRGGAWDTISEPTSRVVFRWYYSIQNDKPQNNFGFRVVLESASGQ